ncbi:hypothetical protein [Lichenicola sp.]|uniref:hypothetical protein n=1 Tax=Lichenicola sp. TaxID=2804529 RepID=UPI003AFFD0AB
MSFLQLPGVPAEPGAVLVAYRNPAAGADSSVTRDLVGCDSSDHASALGSAYLSAFTNYTDGGRQRKLEINRTTYADSAGPALALDVASNPTYGAWEVTGWRSDGISLALLKDAGQAATLPEPKAGLLRPMDLGPEGCILGGSFYGRAGQNWFTGEIAALVELASGSSPALVAAAASALDAKYTVRPVGRLMFAGFQGTYRTGNENLVMARSDDGLSWTETPSHLLPPPGHVLRDPSVLRWGGSYVMVASNLTLVDGLAPSASFDVYTSSGPDRSNGGLWSWTFIQSVDCASVTGTDGHEGAWAPDLFVDTDGSLHAIFAGSRNATALRGFELYDLSWPASAPIDATPAGPTRLDGTATRNMIDPTVRRDGGVYTLYGARLGSGARYIETLTAHSVRGPWVPAHTGDWAAWGQPFEGPIVADIAPFGRCVYLDPLGNGYRRSCSTDGVTWSAPEPLSGPGLLEHGSIFALSGKST